MYLGLKLVIAEKPSVAQSIAKVLGATNRCDGYLKGGEYLVSWCIGHLVELAQPQAYDVRYAKWRKEDLPILPDKWQYRVSEATKKQFSNLRYLMERSDVDSLICATDAGREGELIFRLVYHQCGCKKPFSRLWISSMEESAIRDGFAHLKPSSEKDALYEAALCRARADWIVGINATRLFSCLYGQTLQVGRVMTPTLAMTVVREAKIAAFVPETFYSVVLGMTGGFSVASKRIAAKADAESLLSACRQEENAAVQKIECKEKAENPPPLYDLTSLQRDANRLLGYTAQQTLDYAQSLYEKRLITYPRTDSRYLTEDVAASLPELVQHTKKCFTPNAGALPINEKQVVNPQKVSDHHALLPTRSIADADLAALPAGEYNILRLIAARLLVAVNVPYRHSETTLQSECAGEIFTSKGQTILDEGWKGIERQTLSDILPKSKEAVLMPRLQENAKCQILSAELKEGQTSPPKHYTEDTLLAAMETAGAEEMPEEAERHGIGTPATRAGIIEKLVQKGFVERTGSGKAKALMPTEKGKALITVMPEQIQSPAMTAEWEEKLLCVERGELEPDEFMQEINEMTALLVATSEAVKGAEILMPKKIVVGTCPHCGAEVLERQKGWFCSNRECRFVLWKDNAYFKRLGKNLTGQMVDKLLRDGRIRLKDCKSAKTGKTYNATALLTTAADGKAVFELQFEKGGERK
jgi:DNA topoisomerase-3